MKPLPHWIPQTLNEARGHYIMLLARAEQDDNVQETERLLAQCDLFYLLTVICQRKDMVHPWLFDRCREVQASPDGHIDLWAREHYKSTLITFGLTIQDILNNPEITVGIFSHRLPVK